MKETPLPKCMQFAIIKQKWKLKNIKCINCCVRVKDLYQQNVSKADIMCKTNTMKNQSNFNSTELDWVKELTAHVD